MDLVLLEELYMFDDVKVLLDDDMFIFECLGGICVIY